MSLTFYPKNHSYRLDGKPVPGVTTLIGKGLPKPALPYWSAKTVAEFVTDNRADVEAMWDKGRGPMVAYLKAVPWQARDDAAARGTDVHRLAELLAHGEPADVPEHLVGYVEGYAHWLDTWQPEVLLTERPVASRQWGYAGTFDLIARIGTETWLLDVKTSKAAYGSNALQLAAYANAEFYVDDNGDERPMPRIDRLGVLLCHDGETELYPATDPAAAWKAFQHVAWVARQVPDIDNQFTAPLRAPGVAA